MGRSQREKGKRVERLWRNELRKRGYSAHRSAQHKGSPGSPDVECEALDWLHFEVKGGAKLNGLQRYVSQAESDAGPFRMPAVCWKEDKKPWLVVMRSEDFFGIIGGYEKVKGENAEFARREREREEYERRLKEEIRKDLESERQREQTAEANRRGEDAGHQAAGN